LNGRRKKKKEEEEERLGLGWRRTFGRSSTMVAAHTTACWHFHNYIWKKKKKKKKVVVVAAGIEGALRRFRL